MFKVGDKVIIQPHQNSGINLPPELEKAIAIVECLISPNNIVIRFLHIPNAHPNHQIFYLHREFCFTPKHLTLYKPSKVLKII